MKAYRSYAVRPRLPEELEPLPGIAMNLWWSYTPDARELLRRIDPDQWERSGHNPVAMLSTIPPQRWQELQRDESFLQHLQHVRSAFAAYLESETWFGSRYPDEKHSVVAYFSFEYGLSEALPLYAGGLGVLAGDHLKSASDMGVPIVGMGLLYQVGYFRQYLNADGWQQEDYSESDFHQMPVEQVTGDDGGPLSIEVPMADRTVHANIWLARIGRTPLYLLDTNHPANSPGDRRITYQLYGGDLEMRIRQEILLGIGGVEALRRCVRVQPGIYHLNEGHAAFLVLERIRCAMRDHDLSFEEAVEATRAGNVFTTHTPVTAGHDCFPPELIERYFARYHAQLDLTVEQFMQLGTGTEVSDEGFSMTVLALRLSAWRNGVSHLHARVSRRTWQRLWPEVPEDEIPIDAVTNGVHLPSMVSDEIAALFDRYLGSHWRTDSAEPEAWERVSSIPETELWRAHERRRERLVAVARRRLHSQLSRRGANDAELERSREALDPEALTIGFGRRFATYKRATLILRDPARLKALLTDRDRPVQLIFAGKAHPEDRPGKELIRQIVHLTRDPELRNRIVFLENYDLRLARYIVQGVDVWLNTPLRPLEASGTSGMKVTANGGLNCSVLDGWWDEAYTPESGWVIGRGEEYSDREQQDHIEADALYTLLEQEIVPLFFERGADGIPHGWVAKMKGAIRAVCPGFNSNRMVRDYVQRFYVPGLQRSIRMTASNCRRARLLADWRRQVDECWPQVRFTSVSDSIEDATCFGDEVVVRAELSIDNLSPREVLVQLHCGSIDAEGRISEACSTTMQHIGPAADGVECYEGRITCEGAGRWGYSVRAVPLHEDIISAVDTGCILRAA